MRCSYKSSTCVTLVAFCELLSESAENKTLKEGLGIDASYLVSHLSDVPAGKHDRAALAVAALRSALKKTVASQNRSPTKIKGDKQ